ncbi:hypothetical protein Cgig2_012235 [Carnegiea gigantea]|uniref:Myosin motor domain-containing protein n=1 Tax=Carnegiea gigantea TaxID=171969 RepID=A0A9Q1QP41_9CARY|nr:hypothetical protein Cgig2_012235 [Carnegiea gigantea]
MGGLTCAFYGRQKPGGIIALLDEACMFPRSTHETFAEKLYQTFNNHKRFSKPKLSRTDFTICHYAGEVTYQTEFFLDKNKDYVVPEHQELLSASKCAFVASLFPPLPEDSSKSAKFSSIGTRFKQQLQSLLETLNATEPHYIRCIKPNNLLKPAIFENSNVLQQLRCGGVLEAIRISCAGFPTRKPFSEFIDRCRVLAPEVTNGSCDEATACRKILEKVKLQGYQIGKTKVFLRAGQMAEIDAIRNEVLGRSATIIQRKFKTYSSHKWFIGLQAAATQIQAYCRGAVINALSWCRQYLARQNYKRKIKAAIATQCAIRKELAKRELTNLRKAAKETGALQEAKGKLEKQVEELTLHLEMEKRKRADIEEMKTQENAKLQQALQELRALLEKEHGAAASKVTGEVLAAQGAPAIDNELINRLTAENERLKADLEETKKQENAKIQLALQEMQKKFQESANERGESVGPLVLEIPIVKEVPVVKEVEVTAQELIDKLTAENDQLKVTCLVAAIVRSSA